jgi:hypothetical protein
MEGYEDERARPALDTQRPPQTRNCCELRGTIISRPSSGASMSSHRRTTTSSLRRTTPHDCRLDHAVCLHVIFIFVLAGRGFSGEHVLRQQRGVLHGMKRARGASSSASKGSRDNERFGDNVQRATTPMPAFLPHPTKMVASRGRRNCAIIIFDPVDSSHECAW